MGVSNTGRAPRALAIAILAATAGLSPALAADPVEGERLAERWCAACHVVSPDQESAMDAVPSFRAIAERGERTGDALAAFLASPHPPMPDMALTRREIEDLVAYIDSLGD